MDQNKWTSTLERLKHNFLKRQPEIYTGAGIVFGVAALVLGVVGTVKACKRVEEVKKEQETDKLPVKEVAKHTWAYYIPALVAEGVSITFMIGSNKASKHAIAALSTAYSLSETAFKRYKDQVVQSFGEKKEKEVREKVNDNIIEKRPPQKEIIIETDHGDTLFFDVVSGQYFTSNIEVIKQIINELNRRMLLENYISLNEFYRELGIEEADCGEWLGWNIEKGYINVYFDAKLTKNGQPCAVLNYSVPPIYNYDTYK